ncbi:hypothetical protein M407DRAFT_34741 [Tulasnella calospora MUT 4182]|uniref:BTB domain-containing protein n=1 Tax=Tulasnella calospora MUT 4182 TaxID=1051891 RepID=A0A0C3PMS8_9AGAM|nr:hypothetical protein M407DRAFT_34741 [Tulasnella calospora MUT 4182]
MSSTTKKKGAKSPSSTSTAFESTSNSRDLSSDPLVIKSRLYRKHKHHWYDEGNIAFLVENTAFRLHGSVLSRKSSVMADLLSIPNPSPSNPLDKSDDRDIIIDGVPFVVLHDKAKDFSHVLDFIYPKTLPGAQTEHLGVHDLMGMVRLAEKYHIQDVQEWAVSKLGKEFLLQKGHRSFARALKDEKRYADHEFCVQVIQFARRCSLPQFLPLAFYALATKDWSARPGAAICLQKLSLDDQCRIHEGRAALTREVLIRAWTMPENHGAVVKCSSWSCKRIGPTLWKDAMERWENLMLHPLEELESRLSHLHASLCAGCMTEIHRRTREFRDDLVRLLANFFTLD